MTLLLTKSDVAAVLSLDDCIDAVEEVFRRYGGRAVGEPRTLELHGDRGTLHVKAALAGAFVAKMNANFPRNPAERGLPTIQGVIVVVDAEDGSTLGILDSGYVTALRTAAATAVAAKYLARRDARTLAIVGCGVQGRMHADALLRVRPVERVRAYDADRALASRVGDAAESIEEAVADADMIVTCTPSTRPLLDERHLRPGLFIAGVGADNPSKHELAPSLLARSLVVPDLTAQARAMGDLHHAPEAPVYAELPDIVCGRVPGRTSDEQTFVFDSTGTALQDAAAATIALRRARERRIGREVSF